ncbi:hypothetical protein [Comamonas serinivorans]|uniref:hypothetical protein n=1 Tax=Comamonas serinivorans TaxID=1082851 RepID=UPI0012FAA12A|nr:hypothetical protein [Comamonas serinivorans]
MLPRVASLAVWGLAFGCAVYWGLQLSNPSQLPASVAASGFAAQVDSKAVGRLLGQTDGPVTTATAPASRYDLLGVVRNGPSGAAIISVDGRPARHIVVGRPVGDADGGVTLSELGERSATLRTRDGASVQLTMQALTSPYTVSNGAPASAVKTPPLQPAAQAAAARAVPSASRLAQGDRVAPNRPTSPRVAQPRTLPPPAAEMGDAATQAPVAVRSAAATIPQGPVSSVLPR